MISYRKETELLQYFELQMSERHKTDVFLMFHFKIITGDLFLKKYIKPKLLEPQQLGRGRIWRQLEVLIKISTDHHTKCQLLTCLDLPGWPLRPDSTVLLSRQTLKHPLPSVKGRQNLIPQQLFT